MIYEPIKYVFFFLLFMNLVYDYQINIKSTKAQMSACTTKQPIKNVRPTDKNANLLASIVNDIF